tara:strand:- start:7312 stop:8640 length:1329 start_codon:yes stop_codon:yes gene_type:complete
MNINTKNSLIIFLTFFIYVSFVLGFYFNENSIGSGGYDGDLVWMWNNFEIYKTYDLWTAIHHPDFFGNRTPLLYILHVIFNPFIFNIDSYRLTVFCISFLAPVAFYLCLIQKFRNIDKTILFFISSFILLSPFYRTSAYWGMEIQYGIIAMLASIFFLNSILNENINSKPKLYLLITLLTFFSSLCLYFDQKLLIIPLVVLFKIFQSKISLRFKIFSLINYCIFAIPFLYLLIIWKGIVPPYTQQANVNTITSLSRLDFLWFEHIGYATTIIAFYLLPIILFKDKDLSSITKNFFSRKNNYIIISFFLVYLVYLLNFFDYREFTTEKYWIGLGYIHKISLLLFKSYLLQEIFTYFAFLISWIVILIFIEKNLNDFLIILYFYFLSLLLWPLMQEYFDPIFLLLVFTIFSTKLFINYKNSLFLFIYLGIFLISANIYYFIKLS